MKAGMKTGKSLLQGVVLALTVLFALSGSSSKPSDRQAEADLQQWFESRWPGVFLIVDYETLQKMRDNDEACTIEYRAKVRAVKNASGCVQTCCGDVCIDKLVDGFRWITKTPDAPRIIRKGDLFEMRGKKRYVQGEGGRLCENP